MITRWMLHVVITLGAISFSGSEQNQTIRLQLEKDADGLGVVFWNTSNDTVAIPWSETSPFTNFEDDSIRFDINVARNDTIRRLKIIKDIPTYGNEVETISIAPNSSVKKVVPIEEMLKQQNINEYDYIYARYCYINSKGKTFVLVSNKLNK